MVRAQLLADALKTMYNAGKLVNGQVVISLSSKVVINFLNVMQRHGYIGEYIDDQRFRKIMVELNGRLNECGVINPWSDVRVKDIEEWTTRFLPAGQAPGLSEWKLMLKTYSMTDLPSRQRGKTSGVAKLRPKSPCGLILYDQMEAK